MRLAIFQKLSLADGSAQAGPERRRLWFVIEELDALWRMHGLKDAPGPAAQAGWSLCDRFSVDREGVRSLSADLRKLGFCPKPASTIFYRSAELAACQLFDLKVWPSGRLMTMRDGWIRRLGHNRFAKVT